MKNLRDELLAGAELFRLYAIEAAAQMFLEEQTAENAERLRGALDQSDQEVYKSAK